MLSKLSTVVSFDSQYKRRGCETKKSGKFHHWARLFVLFTRSKHLQARYFLRYFLPSGTEPRTSILAWIKPSWTMNELDKGQLNNEWLSQWSAWYAKSISRSISGWWQSMGDDGSWAELHMSDKKTVTSGRRKWSTGSTYTRLPKTGTGDSAGEIENNLFSMKKSTSSQLWRWRDTP